MKKILAITLALVMVLSLFVGCGNKAASGEGEVTKIVVAFPTWSGAPADLQMIQDAMNAISVPAIGVEATLMVVDFASYGQQMTLMMSGDEQLDVISNLGTSYATNIRTATTSTWKRMTC